MGMKQLGELGLQFLLLRLGVVRRMHENQEKTQDHGNEGRGRADNARNVVEGKAVDEDDFGAWRYFKTLAD